MNAYIIASIHVTDAEKYKNYMALSPSAITAAGGKFIVRGGNLEILEGDWSRWIASSNHSRLLKIYSLENTSYERLHCRLGQRH